MANWERRLSRPQARWENTRWRGTACPPPSAAHCPSATRTSFHLTMLLPSLASGTLYLNWRRWRNLQGKLSTVGRCSKNPPLGEELWHLAVLWLLQRQPKHVLGVPAPDTADAINHCYQDMLACAHSIQIMKWRRMQPASDLGQQSSSSTTPRSSFHCPIGSFIASTSHTSSSRCLTPSFRCSPLVCPSKLFGKTKR